MTGRTDEVVQEPARRGATASGQGNRGHEWAWRERLRANPVTRLTYRVVVAVVGLVVVVVGLVLVPYPGPGWLIVIGGVAIWATEFAWAHRLKVWGLALLHRWTEWVKRQSLAVRLGIGLATALFVGAVVIGMLWLAGVPGWLPDVVENPLADAIERYLPAR